ncbi:MAG: serine/threonine protein kinase, partial [Planctomycetaceae bacterium]|nr:serine/threonine protein kinase [Planctomycetaceae bacterium]
MTFDDLERIQQHTSPYSELIDEVCDDFEAAWQRGSRMRMENCLRLVPDAARGELLRELLEIEVEIRVRQGESVLFEQYASRFPEHIDIVKAILQRHTGRRRLGDYELLEQLGRGGMGIVYKARQIYLNQIVAIKILPEQYVGDHHALSRFRREMQLIGGLRHPNIVQAYNAGEADGMHYLVMEYVAGVTLQRLIAELASKRYVKQDDLTPTVVDPTGPPRSSDLPRTGRPPSVLHAEGRITENQVVADGVTTDDAAADSRAEEKSSSLGDKAMAVGAACEAIRQVAMGLHHAYQRGLVHRDIKPGNLMLDRHGLIKVLDLGLGKFQADVMHGDRSMGPLTQVGTTMGTVDYMAPEQWDDPTTVDIRADIYSMGNTLYFLLCGTPPFDGKNYASNRAKLMAHLVAEPPSLQEACPDVPPELEAVYMKMAAKEPGNRYQIPLEVAAALTPFADADALREAIPLELKHISDADRATSSEYDHSAGRDTVASYLYSPSRRRRMTDFVPPPKPWYRRLEFYAFAALFSVVLVVVAVVIGRLGQDHPVTPSDEPAGNLRYGDAAERDAIVADLLELPGLSGATWSSEMPWFTPFVRSAAVDLLMQTTQPETLLGINVKGYLDPDSVKVQQWLWSLTQKTRDNLTSPQRQLVRDLKDLADSNLELDEYADRIETVLQDFVNGNAKQPLANRKNRAVDANTEAMLLHTLSGLKVDKDLAAFAANAREKYREALDAYETDAVSQRLKLLCMTDMARLVGQTLNDYDNSRTLYNAVQDSDHATNLLKAEVLISLGIDFAAQGQDFDRYFQEAETLLTDPKSHVNIGKNHPLLAHIAERHAWCLIDRWQVDKANTLFSNAKRIRDANTLAGLNPFADIYVLHNMHGQAMTTRFRGDWVSARTQYDEVIREIEKKLAGVEGNTDVSAQQLPGRLRYLREMRERLVNSSYRRADCELFSGAASGEEGIQFARAEQWYKEAMDKTNDRATQVALSVKLCLIQTLMG